jgi:hypothetical protein
MLWTSGSFGSRAGGDATSFGSSLTGLVRFGSSPALTAFSMRKAWYFAYLVLEVISGSSFFHMDRISRKVEAARSVSAVLLVRSQYFCSTCRLARGAAHLVALSSVMSLSPFAKVCRAKCSQ